jgi:uncharacterized protein
LIFKHDGSNYTGNIPTHSPVPQQRFECQRGCVNCCDQRGFVYLTEADHLRIAAHLGLTPDAFEKKYLYRTKKLRRLRIPRDVQCTFLSSSGCGIHAVKPLQCQTFPYWPNLLDNPMEWEKTKEWCPGMSHGPLVNIKLAKRHVKEMLAAHPHLYVPDV